MSENTTDTNGEESPIEPLRLWVRLCLALIGVGLIGSGAASVYLHNNQAGSVALIMFGTMLAYIGLSGDRLASLGKDGFKLVTALNKFNKKTVPKLQTVAHTAEKARELLSSYASNETQRAEDSAQIVEPEMDISPDARGDSARRRVESISPITSEWETLRVAPENPPDSPISSDQFLINDEPLPDRTHEGQLDLKRLRVPVILVRLAYSDSFPGGSPRTRYSPTANTDVVIMENTLRWWRCKTALEDSTFAVSERPKAILGLVGPPSKRIVISSIELPETDYFRDTQGDVEFAPFPELTYHDAPGEYYPELLKFYDEVLKKNPNLLNFRGWRFRTTTTVRFGQSPGEQFVWIARNGEVIVGGSNVWPVLD